MHLVTQYTALKKDFPRPLAAMNTKVVLQNIITSNIFWNILNLKCKYCSANSSGCFL